MATNFLWGNVGSVIHLLTFELNALANSGGCAYGPEVGAANSPQLGQLSLHLSTNSLAFTASSFVRVLFVPSTTTASGGIYPTYTSGTTPFVASQNYDAAAIWLNPTTQSANVVNEVATNVIMPAGFFKAVLINNSGLALPGTGNTLDFYPTPTQF